MNHGVTVKTATGVDLALRIAGPGARSYAYVIDWHIRLLLSLALYFLLSLLILGGINVPNSSENALAGLLIIGLPFAVYALYHPVLELVTRGRTPGKRMAGIRIVTEDAQSPGVLAILIRNVLRLVDGLPVAYGVGLVAAHFTRNAVRIGDMAAGTLLVYDGDERGGGTSGALISPAIVERFGVELAELSQEVLDRWDEMAPEQRTTMGVKLLARVAPGVTPASGDLSLRSQLEIALAAE